MIVIYNTVTIGPRIKVPFPLVCSHIVSRASLPNMLGPIPFPRIGARLTIINPVIVNMPPYCSTVEAVLRCYY